MVDLIRILLLLLLMANPIEKAFAKIDSEPPKKRKLGTADQILRGLSTGLIAADWLQTIDGLRKGMEESNPILGSRPSLGKANLLIGAGLLANAFLIPKIRDPDLRKAIWAAVSMLEIDAVLQNRSAGLKFNFDF